MTRASPEPFRADGPYLQRSLCDIIHNMTKPAQSPGEPARVAEQNPYERPSRLGQVVAVVGIVAGVVFVVAVIFFTGVFVGGEWGGYGGPDGWRNSGQMGPGGKPGTCPMMGGGGMMGPGQMWPGGMMGPTPTPTTTAPGTPLP